MSPSRPLREELIEAGARSMHAPYPFDDLAVEEQTVAVNVATDMLDAFLDALSARADEWTDAAYPNSHPALHTVRSMTVRRFLTVLRAVAP